MSETRPYSEEITRTKPSCIAFIVDQSGSMAEGFDDVPAEESAKAQAAAERHQNFIPVVNSGWAFGIGLEASLISAMLLRWHRVSRPISVREAMFGSGKVTLSVLNWIMIRLLNWIHVIVPRIIAEASFADDRGIWPVRVVTMIEP